MRLFLDRQVLKEGSAWQTDIFKAIDHCKSREHLFSAYLKSKVCLEEYNIAWARSRDHGRFKIVPVYWKSAEMPTYMNMLLYADCREEVEEKLGQVVERVTEVCESLKSNLLTACPD